MTGCIASAWDIRIKPILWAMEAKNNKFLRTVIRFRFSLTMQTYLELYSTAQRTSIWKMSNLLGFVTCFVKIKIRKKKEKEKRIK